MAIVVLSHADRANFSLLDRSSESEEECGSFALVAPLEAGTPALKGDSERAVGPGVVLEECCCDHVGSGTGVSGERVCFKGTGCVELNDPIGRLV